jgi:hypothetical protein
MRWIVKKEKCFNMKKQVKCGVPRTPNNEKNHTLPANISTFGSLNLLLQIRLAFSYEIMLCDKQLNLLFKTLQLNLRTHQLKSLINQSYCIYLNHPKFAYNICSHACLLLPLISIRL